MEYLEGDPVKKSSFIHYIDFLDALPEDRLMPNEVNIDGTFVKVMKSRSGMRVAIWDWRHPSSAYSMGVSSGIH